MQLFGSYTSPYVRHCRVVLLETELPCEFIESDGQMSSKHSPAQRLPFLRDRDLLLTDSAPIVRHLREHAGQSFMPTIEEYDQFCLVNTLIDSAVNLFILEKDGLTPEQSSYLKRQSNRIDTCLQTLAQIPLSQGAPYSDFELRLGCVLAWSRFRKRFEFDQHPELVAFLAQIDQYAPFIETAPPNN